MNQILVTHLINKKSRILKFIFVFVISVTSLVIIIINQGLKFQNDENLSASISNNYKVYKLYNSSSTSNNISQDSDILGNIYIPKLNLNYPFFAGISEDLLKISPCRFYGEMPNKASNLCIAGHNYNDERFFSEISTLELDDEIIIEDNNKKQYFYYVFDKYEVLENNLNNVVSNVNSDFELTLITCNNLNNKRLIIKAQKKAY